MSNKVLDYKNLPMKLSAVHTAWLYMVTSKVYEFSQLTDGIVYTILAMLLIGQVIGLSRQEPVDIFKGH